MRYMCVVRYALLREITSEKGGLLAASPSPIEQVRIIQISAKSMR